MERDEKKELFLGVEIGGTKIQLAVGDGSGTLVKKVRFGVDLQAGGAGIRDGIEERLPEVCRDFSLKAAGVGFGGPVDARNGTVLKSHQVEGWDGFALGKWVEDVTGLPALVENDSNCAGWAEYRAGAGRGASIMVYMNIGSGIGGCIVIDGKLYNGRGIGAGEIGHMYVSAFDGNASTLEDAASGWAFQEELRKHYPMQPGEPLTEIARGERSRIDGKSASKAAQKGDRFVVECFRREGEVVGRALASVANLLCPEVIVVGGGLALSGEVLFEPMNRSFSAHLMEPFRGQCVIRPSACGEDVVLTGALLLAAERETA